jgi:hypothetical protein
MCSARMITVLFGTDGYKPSHIPNRLFYILTNPCHMWSKHCSNRICTKQTCRRRNPASKKKKRRMKENSRHSNNWVSQVSTRLRRRVQSQNTKLHWVIPLPLFLPRSKFFCIIQQPSGKLSFCFLQDFRNFVSSTEISPLSPYPHTLPHPSATTWLADVQRQGAMIRSWIFHRADFYTEARVANSQRHHDRTPENQTRIRSTNRDGFKDHLNACKLKLCELCCNKIYVDFWRSNHETNL